MPLKEYRQKRDFSKSPEPPGDDSLSHARRQGGRARYFCVQKHLATQLHYDLRLEHEGVLLSWAVPKGPSLDPTVKRLAMHVEDHPLEYGDFEGVIPDGYGAGVVMLWDYGTWTPETDDVDAALAKGDLKLRLDGYKLKGSWALVRTRGWGGGSRDDSRSWLLIKHRDEWSGPLDIAEFAPLSVKSQGDFADIVAQKAPDVWLSNPESSGGAAASASLAKILDKVEKLGSSASGSGSAAVSASPRRATRPTAKPRATKAPAHTARTRKPRTAKPRGR